MKRLARYLLLVPVVEIRYCADFEEDDLTVDVYVDSDWAGCRSTRKSTSGGMVAVAGDVVKTWSSTQGSIALSVAEAEYYAAVKGAAESLGVQSLLADLGFESKIKMWQD